MISANQAIEQFHKPRMAKLAEFLLTNSAYSYEYFEPPVFDTFMIQMSIGAESVASINYFPIEISDEAPDLFLQLHSLIGDLANEPTLDFYKYLSYANNRTELSSFYLDGSNLFIKSVLIDSLDSDLNLQQFRFLLEIFKQNLLDHKEGFKKILQGEDFEKVIELE